MRLFLHSHRKKIGHGVIIATIVVSTTVLIPTATPVIMYLTPVGTGTIAPGETTDIEVNVNARTPIDSLGATLSYPKDVLEVVGMSKEKSFFDLWTEDLVLHEDSGQIVFSGGTTRKDGLVGTGTIMTLTVRGKTAGEATLSFDNVNIYPHDGSGKAIHAERRSLTFAIAPKMSPSPQSFISKPTTQQLVANRPQSDINGDGKVTLTDLSILMTGLLSSPYNPRHDLNGDGVVSLSDLSVALAHLHSH